MYTLIKYVQFKKVFSINKYENFCLFTEIDTYVIFLLLINIFFFFYSFKNGYFCKYYALQLMTINNKQKMVKMVTACICVCFAIGKPI